MAFRDSVVIFKSLPIKVYPQLLVEGQNSRDIHNKGDLIAEDAVVQGQERHNLNVFCPLICWIRTGKQYPRWEHRSLYMLILYSIKKDSGPVFVHSRPVTPNLASSMVLDYNSHLSWGHVCSACWPLWSNMLPDLEMVFYTFYIADCNLQISQVASMEFFR